MKQGHDRRPLPVDSVEPEDIGRIVPLRAPPAGHQLLAEYRILLTQLKEEVAGQRSLGDASTGAGGHHPLDPH